MEREVMKYELDFSQCKTWGEVYREIKTKLELPDWCGENINAFWDALTGIMYTPAEITVRRTVANNELISMVEQIISVMHRAEDMYHEITVIEE